jgi:hypothetical protein
VIQLGDFIVISNFDFCIDHINKGQVAVRPFFRLQQFLKKITWLESALNSEQNHVFFLKK